MIPQIIKKRNRLVGAFIWLLLCWTSLTAWPQSSLPQLERAPLQFNHLRLPGGEEGNCVNGMVQDSFGFIWFGSHNGLHRYDGYGFKTFLHDPADSSSLSLNYIECLFIDREGILWAGTLGGGLNRYDASTETFTTFRCNPQKNHSLSDDKVYCIGEDTAGYLWIGTHFGLNRLEKENGTFIHFFHDPEDPGSISHDVIQSVLLSRDGNLWIGTGSPFSPSSQGGLNRYHPETQSFTQYFQPYTMAASQYANKIRSLYEDAGGIIWIGAPSDIPSCFDPDKERFFAPALPDGLGGQNHSHSISENTGQKYFSLITFMEEGPKGNFWIGSFGVGLHFYSADGRQALHMEHNPGNALSLSTNNIWSFLKSRDGVVWIGSSYNASYIDFVIPNQYQIPVYKVPNEDAPYSQDIVAVLSDSRRHLWIATGHSLWEYDEEGRLLSTYGRETWGAGPSAIEELFEDSRGRLWVAKGGCTVIEPETETITHFTQNPDDPFSLINNGVFGFAEDGSGDIWISTQAGLCRFDESTGRFYHFRHSPVLENSLPDNWIFAMAPARGGGIWVGTYSGLSLLDPQTGQFKNKILGPVRDIIPAEDGRIWISIMDGKLLRFDPESWQAEGIYGQDEGLASTSIGRILKDKNGHLWVTSGEGLFRFDTITKKFRHFFPHSIFNQIGHACVMLEDGLLLFGSHPGLFAFYPESMSTQTSGAKVVITEFRLNGELQKAGIKGSPLKTPVCLSKEIELGYHQNDFSLSFSAMEFASPEKARYQYQLKGYDSGWRTGSLPNMASYTNMAPGEYQFQVKASDAPGNWSNEITSLDIIIVPPWWRTWWAYILYVLTLSGLGLFLVNNYIQRQLKEAEARRLRELDEAKSRLYTSISHEFRTPLSIISGMAQQIREEPGKWFREGLDMIQNNSRKILHLVNQILDLQKLEGGHIALHYEQGDVLPYLRYLAHSFDSFADMRKVRLHFLAPEEPLIMDYDPEKLMNILSNLLSNAIKFTPEDGDVYVQVEKVKPPTKMDTSIKEALLLKVKDTGVGIPADKLEAIATGFEIGSVKKPEGAGIGLSIVRELVKLINGKVQIRSRKEEGTEFSLWLPITREASLAEESTPEEIALRAGAFVPPAETTPLTFGEQAPTETNAPLALLADDQQDVLSYLSIALSPHYQLITAKDGKEALEKALETVPDIIISDVMMPKMDGIELCAALRADERTSHIPIILLTAKADVASRIEGLEKGADAYIPKPFNKEELLVRMRKLLELRNALKKNYLAAAGIEDGKDAPEPQELLASEDAFVQKVRQSVIDHLDDFDFNVQALCYELHLSPSQLQRKLSALTGLSPVKFIRHLRLNQAKMLLHNPELSITSIAFDTGFNDPDYFSRVFRQEFGKTPTEYREARSRDPDLP
ncbi:MAG: helix-turn-helix domain-containing protein [Lewinellaceae bacterium]|nr:helix-turn-helix domain-containing protein [Lewinellaceae bacterium]MCB9289810.1 helix-turn-helix domain-containing protein [Lewinellaceae bacterium]